MPDPWGMAVVFHGLSRLAADGGAHRGAALLLGFADRLSNTAVAVSPESGAPTAVKEDISERTQYVNLLRAHLSEAGFSAAWEEGCAMTHEQAISYARDTAPTA
jgi:hypothetical protein